MKAIADIWQAYRTRDRKAEADLEKSLAEALHGSPLSLAIGALTGTIISCTIASRSGDDALRLVAIGMALLAIGRLAGNYVAQRQAKGFGPANTSILGLLSQIASWIYAALVGLLAFLTITRVDGMAFHVLSLTLALAHAGGVSRRNAGSLYLAIGRALLTVAPAAVGLWVHGGFEYRALALSLLMMMVAFGEISATTYKVMVNALRGERDKSQLATKYERLARFDSLTGVENRMAMQQRLRELFEKNRRTHDAVSILWMDLDRFKEINDSIGHIVGDHLLCAVAEKLSEALDGRGHVARFGGDEFILICPGVNRIGAQAIAADVLNYFRQSFDVAGHTLSVTASLGIAVAPQDGRDVDELMQHADMALYQAKGNGRNRAVSFTWSMKERFTRLHDIETGLRRAIANGEFSLHFQPMFDLESGKVIACEALLRWTHPLLGSIPPQEFIPVAENTGVIAEISEWVLAEACAIASDWPENVRVSVNMSPLMFQSVDLPRIVISHLMATGLPARRLELEVTESVFLIDQPRTRAMLQDLRKIGLRLALDDFGTGYSSLSYLSTYAFDAIKVDESFMRNVQGSSQTRAVISAIIFLAAELGIDTVAEGIESEDQLAYAKGTGFSYAQGFLLCQPLPRAELARLLAQEFDIGTQRNIRASQMLRKRA